MPTVHFFSFDDDSTTFGHDALDRYFSHEPGRYLRAIKSVLGTGLDPYLTDFFEAKSYPEAHGRNIVNVILVDFRGFDTLGEISVIVIAGIAAIAVLRAGRKASR